MHRGWGGRLGRAVCRGHGNRLGFDAPGSAPLGCVHRRGAHVGAEQLCLRAAVACGRLQRTELGAVARGIDDRRRAWHDALLRGQRPRRGRRGEQLALETGRLSKRLTPKKDIKLYAYSLQTVLGTSIVLFGSFGRQ